MSLLQPSFFAKVQGVEGGQVRQTPLSPPPLPYTPKWVSSCSLYPPKGVTASLRPRVALAHALGRVPSLPRQTTCLLLGSDAFPHTPSLHPTPVPADRLVC